MKYLTFLALFVLASCSSAGLNHINIKEFNSSDYDEDENAVIVVRPYYIESASSAPSLVSNRSMGLFSVIDKASNFVSDIIGDIGTKGKKRLAEVTFKHAHENVSFTIGDIYDEKKIGSTYNNFHVGTVPAGMYKLESFRTFDGDGRNSSVIEIEYDSEKFGEVSFNAFAGNVIYIGDIALKKGGSPRIYDNLPEAQHYTKYILSDVEKKLGKKLILVNENEWASY